jgi:hypothetical protein
MSIVEPIPFTRENPKMMKIISLGDDPDKLGSWRLIEIQYEDGKHVFLQCYGNTQSMVEMNFGRR